MIACLRLNQFYAMPTRKPRIRGRYSIGEWYGIGFEKLNPNDWRAQATEEIKVDGLSGKDCPFRLNSPCNKKGGVCSLRFYEQINSGPVRGTGPIITTCPNRFLEENTIYRWVGETLLGTSEPVMLSEIGFLDRLKNAEAGEEEEDGDFIGRIDNVLLHPERKPLDWCALEIQGVYFSGQAMKKEFNMLAQLEGDNLPFPAAHRRPDWRSSGPKRLLPQLQTKTPTIRTWGKKIAVVIDEAFFGSLVGLDREKHLSNSEIAWFVVAYHPSEKGWKLTPKEVVFTRLEASVKALTGGTPLSKETFEKQLVTKLKLTMPNHPLTTQL
ncbi:MAG: hypothetical protein LV481_15020 [Methylacidiphilales bacterium]|nr:hypothetical protein [Candidatus Methylacidiphilales bacterium]